MADRTQWGSPLGAASWPPRGNFATVRFEERPFVGKLILRGSADAREFLDVSRAVLGFALPTTANTVAVDGDLAALWLGPREWMVTTTPEREADIAERLRRALVGQHAAVTDVSDARTVIRLAGPSARDVLLKGCSLDLHPREFVPGRCAQSQLARAQIILHLIDETPTYDLYVAPSFAKYLWAWLIDAAAEYAIA